MQKLFVIFTLIIALLVAAPAAALELNIGDDTYGLDIWYDYRTFHDSHPGHAVASPPGGWTSVLTVTNSDKAALLSRVELNMGTSVEGSEATIVYTKPSIYDWLGQTNYDYGIMNGNTSYLGQNITVSAYDLEGNPVMFVDNDAGTTLPTISKTVPLGTPMPPICNIKRMGIKKSGDLVVRFTAPEVDFNSQIRIRILDENGWAVHQEKYNPPYEIVKKDTTIVPDKMRVFLPGKYAGFTARIEYRVYDDNGFMARGITYFVLPSIEE